MTDQDEPHPTGELGDETRKLLTAVQEWTQRNFPAPPSGHGGPECQWCPLCQLASALRGEHPELTDRIGEAAAAVANALRVLADPTTERARGAASAQPAAPGPGRRAPRPRVQRIELDEPDETMQ
ncbi:hypothetical protein [uncultured Jatrophihabitans sp.]|uniref:hypothetical protein n=1 Tax=uncultured Jatrophihabitans sp. TaxID=1610747 RepID=UPI0035CA621B